MQNIENIAISNIYRCYNDMKIINEKSMFENFDVVLNEPFTSQHLIIILMISGVVKLKCNLKSVIVGQNSLYIVLPNVNYSLDYFSPDCQFIALRTISEIFIQSGVHLTGSQMFKMIADAHNRNFIISDPEVQIMQAMMTVLEQKLVTNNGEISSNDVIKHQLIALLYECSGIAKRYYNEQEVKLSRKEDLTARFLDLLSKKVRCERGIQFYAMNLAVSVGHLTKTLKEITGKTAGEMIDAGVIIESKVLLNNPGLSIAQVADQLQFSDQSFFGKYFKKNTGMSPSEYRNFRPMPKNNVF